MNMFIGLTPYDDKTKTKYFNTEYIKTFRRDNERNYTVLELYYGTDLVDERPEEIMEMLKGEK